MVFEKIEAFMFNRKAADPKNRPEQILENLPLKEGYKVADLGSGGGYFTIRFSKAVGPKGRVFAVDVKPAFLDIIRQSLKAGVNNVETIRASEDSIPLPENSLDLIFMRNVYHHLPNRVGYLIRLRGLLKQGGKIAVIENNPGGVISRLFAQYVSKETIVDEMSKAGFIVDRSVDILPEQSFTIFSFGRS